MANNPLDMNEVRELLRLCFEQGLSARRAAKILGIGKTSASEYVSGFKSSGLSYSVIESLSDSDLTQVINLKKEFENERYKELSGLFLYFEKELKRTGVTKRILWEEYVDVRKDFYGYSQFCHHYQKWCKDQKVSMHQEHKAGDKLFVDYTGKKLPVTNPDTGEITEHEVFVSILGASQLSYIEAIPSQTLDDWITVNEHTLRFYQGVPCAIVPDCLKSTVNKAHRYEPEINRSYNDFAAHYDTVILPARALHPKDKSLAENLVRNTYQRIFAVIRNEIFFSLEELNNRLWELLERFNNTNFQCRDYSRQELFDEIEKHCLKPLPVQRYEMKTFNQCKVQYNHHIYLKEDKHYYSVPFQLTGKKVVVCFTAGEVEIYYNNKRVATHLRNRHKYGYTTNNDHRPKNHQVIAEWSPERFIKWAQKIGSDAVEVVTKMLDSRKHPEQAYRSCMGLLVLEKKHNKEDYLKACKRALEVNCISYKFIKNTLSSKTFNLSDQEQLDLFKIPEHENIRGKEIYN